MERPMATAVESTLEAGFWDVSLPDYHRDRTCESNSTLKEFLENRWLYYLRRVKRTVPPKPPSDELALGNALHTRLLQPHRYDEDVIVLAVGRGSKKGKETIEANPDKHCITEDQAVAVEGMHAAILAEPRAVDLLSAGGM